LTKEESYGGVWDLILSTPSLTLRGIMTLCEKGRGNIINDSLSSGRGEEKKWKYYRER